MLNKLRYHRPFQISSQTDYLIGVFDKFTYLMTNSADPDQLASQKPTDLDLHCLLRHGMTCSTREGLGHKNVKIELVILSRVVSCLTLSPS